MSTPTQTDIIRAVTNDPALASDHFMLGERSFPLVDLPYDDYLKFFAHLQPVLDNMVGGVTGGALGVSGEFTMQKILEYAGSSLPEMVYLMCKQTDPTITVEDIKGLVRSPFVLAAAVIKQVNHNRMIDDIKDFFAQILPLLTKEK